MYIIGHIHTGEAGLNLRPGDPSKVFSTRSTAVGKQPTDDQTCYDDRGVCHPAGCTFSLVTLLSPTVLQTDVIIGLAGALRVRLRAGLIIFATQFAVVRLSGWCGVDHAEQH